MEVTISCSFHYDNSVVIGSVFKHSCRFEAEIKGVCTASEYGVPVTKS